MSALEVARFAVRTLTVEVVSTAVMRTRSAFQGVLYNDEGVRIVSQMNDRLACGDRRV